MSGGNGLRIEQSLQMRICNVNSKYIFEMQVQINAHKMCKSPALGAPIKLSLT